MGSFTNQSQKMGSLIYNYFATSLNLYTHGKRLIYRMGRKDGSYKVISGVRVHVVDDEENCDKLHFENNDVVIVEDYIIKVYAAQQGALKEIDEETLILTKNNQMFFYDDSEDALVYFSGLRNDFRHHDRIIDYHILKDERIKPNEKYKQRIRKKLIEEQVDIDQINPKAINAFSNYIADSSYWPSICSILIAMFVYAIAVVAAAAFIIWLATTALEFAIVVAVTAPISSGIAAIISLTEAAKNKSELAIYAGLSSASSGIGFLLLALAVIFPYASPVLAPLGLALCVAGFIGTTAVCCVKYKHKLYKYYRKAVNLIKNKIITPLKECTVADHIRNTAYLGAIVTTGIFAAAVVCAFIFLPAVPVLLAVGTVTGVASIGGWVTSKIIKHKDKIVNSFHRVKNFVKAIPDKCTGLVKNIGTGCTNLFTKIFKKKKTAVAKTTNIRHKIVKKSKIRQPITESSSKIKQLMYEGMIASMMSCPTLTLYFHHMHKSVHTAAICMGSFFLFGVLSRGLNGFRIFFKRTNKKSQESELPVSTATDSCVRTVCVNDHNDLAKNLAENLAKNLSKDLAGEQQEIDPTAGIAPP